MIALTLEEVARLCAGRLHAAQWAGEITGVQIDSRRIEEGDLFVAVGPGADFTKHAFARGAAATLVPDDAFAALGALGGAVRDRTSASVVGITGSTGKTSTKDVLAALLRPHARVVAAEASYNAELGVPLTLCRLEQETEIIVLELAMRGFGQIAYLCEIARPEIGVITNVAPVHLELVSSLEGVARAKAELIQALPRGGSIVAPSDAPVLEPYLERAGLTVIRFGPGGDLELERFAPGDDSSELRVRAFSEDLTLEVNFLASYQASNTLAALGAYHALGLPLGRAAEGAAEIEFNRWRGEETPLPGEGLLINDAYNANPISMRAALEHQAERAGSRRRVAVLGEMAELGPRTLEYHVEIGRLAAELGVSVLIAVGGMPARSYLDSGGEIPQTEWAAGIGEAIAAVWEQFEPGDCVLVKGSRVVGLEAVADALAAVRA